VNVFYYRQSKSVYECVVIERSKYMYMYMCVCVCCYRTLQVCLRMCVLINIESWYACVCMLIQNVIDCGLPVFGNQSVYIDYG